MCLHPISPKVSTLRRNFFLAKNYFHPLIQEKEEPRKKAEWKNLMQCKKYLAVVIPVQFPLPLPFSLKEKENEEGNKRNGMSSTITCRAAIAMHSRNCGRTCNVHFTQNSCFHAYGKWKIRSGGGIFFSSLPHILLPLHFVFFSTAKNIPPPFSDLDCYYCFDQGKRKNGIIPTLEKKRRKIAHASFFP